MRRLVFATWVLSVSGVACVSNDPVQPPTPLYPVYRIRAERNQSVDRHTRTCPASAVRTRCEPSWHPRRGRISPRWTHIVIHHSATDSGGARCFDRYHRKSNGWDELGYHFVIGNGTDTPDGYIEVGSRWHKQKHGAHCKTPDNYYNEHGIGICLVGDFSKSKPTPRQLASLERLVRFLCDKCGIPPGRVTTHRAVTRKTECPGRHFKLATLRRALVGPPTATSMP